MTVSGVISPSLFYAYQFLLGKALQNFVLQCSRARSHVKEYARQGKHCSLFPQQSHLAFTYIIPHFARKNKTGILSGPLL